MNDSTELRRRFLKNADVVFEEIQARTLGTKSPHPFADKDLLKAYWDALVPMAQAADDVQKLNAKSTNNIVTQLSKGKITVAQALQLMELLQIKQEIDELPLLVQQLKDAGLMK